MKFRSLLCAALMLPAMALAQDAPAEGEAPADEEAPAEEAAPAGPVSYTLAPGKGFLAVVVYKDPNTLGSGLAHDHVMVSPDYTGSVTWNWDDASACKVDIQVPIASLQVDPGNTRARVGIDPDDGVGDGDKAKIRDNFMGKSQLDAANHPTITYSANSCSAASGKVDVKGTLTIRGKAVPVSTTMDVSGDPSSFKAAGTLKIKATQFGFDPFSALFGQLKNQDEMKLIIEVQGGA